MSYSFCSVDTPPILSKYRPLDTTGLNQYFNEHKPICVLPQDPTPSMRGTIWQKQDNTFALVKDFGKTVVNLQIDVIAYARNTNYTMVIGKDMKWHFFNLNSNVFSEMRFEEKFSPTGISVAPNSDSVVWDESGTIKIIFKNGDSFSTKTKTLPFSDPKKVVKRDNMIFALNQRGELHVLEYKENEEILNTMRKIDLEKPCIDFTVNHLLSDDAKSKDICCVTDDRSLTVIYKDGSQAPRRCKLEENEYHFFDRGQIRKQIFFPEPKKLDENTIGELVNFDSTTNSEFDLVVSEITAKANNKQKFSLFDSFKMVIRIGLFLLLTKIGVGAFIYIAKRAFFN
jgi:hypothetical protein